MNWHILFSIAGVATEVAVVALLLRRRVWRSLPFFLAYCVWALLSDGAMLVLTLVSPNLYSFNFYAVSTSIDSTMQFSVIVELAWSVLRPVRNSLSPKAVWAVGALIVTLTAMIWPFADVSSVALPSHGWYVLMQMQQTVSILRVVFFMVLAASSQLLALGWRDRELQVASGFGFYSLVSLGTAAVNAHLATSTQIVDLYYLVAASFLTSLGYWVVCFAQQEAARREFTPEAQQLLIAVAKYARMTRVQMTEMEGVQQ